MLFFTIFLYTETDSFFMTKVIAATAANIYSFCPTDFTSLLCQELDIYQAIWCICFPLYLSWGTMSNNFSNVTSIFYRLSCLVSSCTSFSPPVVNHLLCEIVIELFRVPVIPPITSPTNIVVIIIIHSKY